MYVSQAMLSFTWPMVCRVAVVVPAHLRRALCTTWRAPSRTWRRPGAGAAARSRFALAVIEHQRHQTHTVNQRLCRVVALANKHRHRRGGTTHQHESRCVLRLAWRVYDAAVHSSGASRSCCWVVVPKSWTAHVCARLDARVQVELAAPLLQQQEHERDCQFQAYVVWHNGSCARCARNTSVAYRCKSCSVTSRVWRRRTASTLAVLTLKAHDTWVDPVLAARSDVVHDPATRLFAERARRRDHLLVHLRQQAYQHQRQVVSVDTKRHASWFPHESSRTSRSTS